MKPKVHLLTTSGIWLLMSACLEGGSEAVPQLGLVDSQVLPNHGPDGQRLRVHTQGLYVTQRFYYVTGRWERSPKRAILFRFAREDPRRFEALDITPPGSPGMDHPGGFDCDGTSLWIPIGMSRPRSPTAVMRLVLDEDQPLHESQSEIAFHVDDHIGAIAWSHRREMLCGANWDTRHIYTWDTTGYLREKVSQAAFFAYQGDDRGMHLAVQDWKHLKLAPQRELLVAGGIDKSPGGGRPRALLQIFDPDSRTVLTRFNPVGRSYDGPLTNEGMAVRDGTLFLVPADLGSDARIYRFALACAGSTVGPPLRVTGHLADPG